jgi:hypothetical protein
MRRSVPAALAVLPATAAAAACPAAAQQFVVDDASIPEARACQVEAWWGEAEAWVLPSCHLLPATELTLGVIHMDAGFGSRDLQAVVEAKRMFRDADALGWGWSVAAGFALPVERGHAPTGAYAYVPTSFSLARVPAVLHLNLGWGFERENHGDHAHDHHGVLWGVRGDLEASGRLTLIGELFGLSGDGAELQVGLRTTLVSDRLALDLSRGFHLSRNEDGLGFQVGVAWTPGPIL